ncbi:MAG: protein translocase subunit SecA [Porticoccaceae bacterium]|nr:MAG: protein translocase subunit SecA [Porticoccaceae bacterium]
MVAARILTRIIGSRNERILRRMRRVVARINALEEAFKALSDEALRAKTDEFRERLAGGATLDELLPEAFAAVREAARRTIGLRHFDVQLIGGMVLHEGKIAEMKTGEGKTLVATLAAYLNALPGKGVHVVTVNDYLAARDAQWMGPVYHALGLSVGVIQSYRGAGLENSFLFSPGAGEVPLELCSRREAYAADITYGTNNEFGFDYLRDNMALRLEDKVQRGHHYAIVDEVDSILIDEARTPLIISGAARDSSALYKRMNELVKALKPQRESEEGATEPGDFVIDEKTRQVELTEQGHEKAEQLLLGAGLLAEGESLYQPSNLVLLHHLHTALRAHHLFHRDVDYILQGNQVVLIDEHTGRTMPGRRLSEGLHQAIEAKEGVPIQSESQTLASTTFQNYFRIYEKLAGMTGTADTEAYEFHQIYGLEVVVIPTNVPVRRRDLNDLVFLTQKEKFAAVVEHVKQVHASGAPVLVGTTSVENSEIVSALMKKAGLPHNVLNAKHHEREAQIIAEAGRLGSITVATNMAGRGTDIRLQSFAFPELLAWWRDHGLAPADATDPEDPALFERLTDFWVEKFLDEKARAKLARASLADKRKALLAHWEAQGLSPLPFEPVTSTAGLGGLHIIGTERHESRRIDNQLRGRAGRQGDPGLSRFYLSLEDPLMRLFASDRVRSMMRALGMEGEAIEHRMVTNAIEKAQRKVEGRNFDIRKQLLEYDDVANDQRRVIYQQRDELLAAEEISDLIREIRADAINGVIDRYIPPQSLAEQWDVPGLEEALKAEFDLELDLQGWLAADKRLHEEKLRERILAAAEEAYARKCEAIGPDMRLIEKQVMLQVLDMHWKDHLANMDYLRQGIGLRAYAQKNPRQEYKREAFELFRLMLDNIKLDTIRFLSRIEVRSHQDVEEAERRRAAARAAQQMSFRHESADALAAAAAEQGEAQPAPPPPRQPFVREGAKVGRNEPCPCGSGRKYKHCCGRLA